MPESSRWVELTKTVGEISARLIAGDLENEEIRTHIEMAPSSWFYGAEDPNRLVTIYVLPEDLPRAESLLEQASAEGADEIAMDLVEEDVEGYDEAEAEAAYPIFAEEGSGLRSRPLRWALAAVIVGALVFGFLRGTVFDIFS